MDLIDDSLGFSTACHRRYIGTWEISDGTLYLLHLNMMVPDEEPMSSTIRERLFRVVPATSFPIKAQWFNGKLRIAMLFGQGQLAASGKHGHIVNDRMIGGFALIASPAEYGNSGVMTFIVNQNGDVFEKDLGPERGAAASIKSFNPDPSWKKVAAQ